MLLIVLSAVDGRRGITTLQPPSQKPVARQVCFFCFCMTCLVYTRAPLTSLRVSPQTRRMFCCGSCG